MQMVSAVEMIELGGEAGAAAVRGESLRYEAAWLKAAALGMVLEEGANKRLLRFWYSEGYREGERAALDDIGAMMESERAAERSNELVLSGAYWGPDHSDPMSVADYYGGL